MQHKHKQAFFILVVIAIVTLALASTGPMVYKAITSTGVKAGGLNSDGAVAATTDLNGEWTVVNTGGPNSTAVGFTFHEVLPGQAKETSGISRFVIGSATINDNTLTAGEVTVDLTKLSTDVEKRDIHVRNNILHTDDYPTATFTVTEPVSLANVPEDGTPGTVTLTGDLELHGVTKQVSGQFEVLRTGKRIIVAGDLPINRLDFDVDPGQFVAAKIDEKGLLNIRVALEKQ